MVIPKKGHYIVQVQTESQFDDLRSKLNGAEHYPSWRTGGSYEKGMELYVIDGAYNGYCHLGYARASGDYTGYTIISYTNMLSLKEKFAVAFKGEPEKSFIKAEVMNVDESLTTDGTALFMAYLLKKNGADFKKEVVDLILAEDEAKKSA